MKEVYNLLVLQIRNDVYVRMAKFMKYEFNNQCYIQISEQIKYQILEHVATKNKLYR